MQVFLNVAFYLQKLAILVNQSPYDPELPQDCAT